MTALSIAMGESDGWVVRVSRLTFGSLFAGIGGMDLGLERAGMECRWQVEKDKKCIEVLERHWTHVKRFEDAITAQPGYADVIAGGDPCPSHSKARSIWGSTHPDLSGYFLAMVGGLRPWWVVRENVPSPSSARFCAALEAIGYGCLVVEIDAAGVTGQSRLRQFVIGRREATGESIAEFLLQREDVTRTYEANAKKSQVAACLTTHPCRYDTRDNYVFDGRGLRILDGDEREKLAGFPSQWTAGFSEGRRAKFYGNAVVPQIAEWIGRRIIAAEGGR